MSNSSCRQKVALDERLQVLDANPGALLVGARPSGYPRAWFGADELERAAQSGRGPYALGDYLLRVMGVGS